MPKLFDTPCNGREGVLYIHVDGELQRVATKGVSARFKCTCEAKQATLRAIGTLLALATMEMIPVSALPKPDDFIYEYIDEAPKEVEPTSCDDARGVLAKIMEGSK